MRSVLSAISAILLLGVAVEAIQYSHVVVQPNQVRRHPDFVATPLLSQYDASITTGYDLFLASVAKFRDREFLGHLVSSNGAPSHFDYETYGEISGKAQLISSALSALKTQAHQKVGFFMANCPEWLIAEQACFMGGFITVPVYATFGKEAVEYILEHSEMQVLFSAKSKLTGFKSFPPSLKIIVLIDELGASEKPAIENVEVFTFAELLELGGRNIRNFRHTPPSPDDIYTICYTSGTTGTPKGVLLKHSALIASIAGIHYLADKGEILPFTSNDRTFSYLPLSHIFERLMIHVAISYGMSIAIFSGNKSNFQCELRLARPTLLVAVPSVLERFYSAITARVSQSFLRSFIFKRIMNAKKTRLDNGQDLSHPILDAMLESVRKRFGGRLRGVLTGSAPISAELVNFSRFVFGNLYEGYGLTESHAATFLTRADETKPGVVGGPLPPVEFALSPLEDVYDGILRGEILLRGLPLFSGYYKNPEATAEAITSENWFRTGDIGQLDPTTGSISIIDRCKNLFKLAQGEFIAPDKVQTLLAGSVSSIIEEIFIPATPGARFIIAIVYPKETFTNKFPFSYSNGDDPFALNENEALVKTVFSAISKQAQLLKDEQKINSLERPAAILLVSKPFSSFGEEDSAGALKILTPTLKVIRRNLEKTFEPRIKKLMEGLQDREN